MREIQVQQPEMRGERNWGYTSLIDFVIEQMLLKPKSSKIHSPLLQVFEAVLNKGEKSALCSWHRAFIRK